MASSGRQRTRRQRAARCPNRTAFAPIAAARCLDSAQLQDAEDISSVSSEGYETDGYSGDEEKGKPAGKKQVPKKKDEKKGPNPRTKRSKQPKKPFPPRPQHLVDRDNAIGRPELATPLQRTPGAKFDHNSHKKPAGRLDYVVKSNGYYFVQIKQKRYTWLGKFPITAEGEADCHKAAMKKIQQLGGEHVVAAPRQPTSDFAGVFWQKSRGKWTVTIYINREQHFIGDFEVDEEHNAALAYDQKALDYGMTTNFVYI